MGWDLLIVNIATGAGYGRGDVVDIRPEGWQWGKQGRIVDSGC
jgi:hypothetical protein